MTTVVPRSALVAENLLLRSQLALFAHQVACGWPRLVMMSEIQDFGQPLYLLMLVMKVIRADGCFFY